MFQNILGTFGTKVFSAALNFLIVILTTQYLGASGRGTISLIIVTVTIILMFNNFVGGSSLIYLVPRKKLFHLLVPSYLWAIIICSLSYLILPYIKIVPSIYVEDVFFLSLLFSFFHINLMLFIGKEKIMTNNYLSLVQILLHTLILAGLFMYLKEAQVSGFIYSLYFSYSIGLLISLALLMKYFSFPSWQMFLDVIRETFRYGSVNQLANISQFLCYRLNFFILNIFATTALVGIYSVGVSLAEAIWMICNSIALVQYAKIANTKDLAYSRELTLRLARMSLVASTIALIPLMLFPPDLFAYIFGKEFSEVRRVIIYMSPGIAALGMGVIISHYFGGIGKYHINARTSFAGLVVTVIFGFILIPEYGYVGASITASLAYLSTTLWLIVEFIKETKYSVGSFIPNKNDLEYFRNEVILVITGNAKNKTSNTEQ
ncbi:polysaccharide biosynthesis C-terminal domain-containing protein [Candidatus Amoebophilus asiaticus]|nr:polysaccharide biosynthesis C-terminal domain-containing protein [Candidatus Amoebophilus asiaticus]